MKSPSRIWLPLTALVVLLLGGGVVGLTSYRALTGTPAPAIASPATPARPASFDDYWRPPPAPLVQGAPAAPRTVTAIAVLPFTTQGEPSASVQRIADVITDELTNIISRVGSLRVISLQSVRYYQGRHKDVAAVAAELKVHYVLEGSVRMVGDRLRVNVQLIDPKSQLSLWSQRIEREDAEQTKIQDEIVARLARELQFETLKADSARIWYHPDVYDLTRLGWKAILETAVDGRPALERAKELFTQALAREPDNWSARAGLGAYHANIGSLLLVPDWRAQLDKGQALLEQLIRERPNEAQPYLFLGIIHRQHGRFDEGIGALERCIAIAPSEASCYAHIGHAMIQRGQFREGIEHVKYAFRLSPNDLARGAWKRFLADGHMEILAYDEAVGFLRESYEINPGQPMTLRGLIAANALAGNFAEVDKFVSEMKVVAPHFTPQRMVTRPPPFDKLQPELTRGLRLAFAPRP